MRQILILASLLLLSAVVVESGMVSNSCQYIGTVNSVIGIAGPGFSFVTAVRVPIEGGDLYIECHNSAPRCWNGFNFVSCSCDFSLQLGDCVSAKGVLRENSQEVYCAADTFQALAPSKCQ